MSVVDEDAEGGKMCMSSEERVIKSIAGCILSTLRASREMALKLPDDKKSYGWGYVGGLANALVTVCCFSRDEDLQRAAREYMSDIGVEMEGFDFQFPIGS